MSADSARAARQHPLSWLLKQIEDVYDARYAQYVLELEAMAGADPDAVDELGCLRPFPEFVKNWCGRRYGVRALAEKAAWEVMCNAEAARSAGLHSSVDVFCAFCNRGYDDEELLFFLYCRQTMLLERAKAVQPSDENSDDARRRFVPGAATVSAPDVLLDETSAQQVTRLIFGSGAGGRGMLYQAVLQLLGEFFDERRDALRRSRAVDVAARRSRGKGKDKGVSPGTARLAKPPEARMEGYYYLKLMLSAYRDTRPDRDGSELGGDEILGDDGDGGVAARRGGVGEYWFGDADPGDDFEEDPGTYDDREDFGANENEPEERGVTARIDRRVMRAGSVFASRDANLETAAATTETVLGEDPRGISPNSAPPPVGSSSPGSNGSPVDSPGDVSGSDAPFRSNPAPLDPRGASVRLARRAITESCSKYCDVLLQVAQDLAPDVLAGLKQKAVLSLDGRSQALFSGALAAAFGSDPGGGPSGPDAAVKVAGREPDVVAAVAKSVTALLRDSRLHAESGARGPSRSGSGEAREIARVVLASRTIRSHVEPMLAALLSELDDDEEEVDDGDGSFRSSGSSGSSGSLDPPSRGDDAERSEERVVVELGEHEGEDVSTEA